MIHADFVIRGGNVSSFTVKGHSDFAASGEDIICAAVSSAVFMAVNTITEITGEKCTFNQEDGYISFGTESTRESVQTVLNGLVLHISELSKQYPKYIKVNTEV